MTLPVCAVTGRIAGDSDACGGCDPCSAAHAVPDAVKRLLTEKEEWRQKYADAAVSADEAERLRAALEPFAAAVFNDNGDMTISPVTDRHAYSKAYFAVRGVEQSSSNSEQGN
jgi:hypothetical protein